MLFRTDVKMRVFSENDGIIALEKSGLNNITIHKSKIPHHGLFFTHTNGIPIKLWKK